MNTIRLLGTILLLAFAGLALASPPTREEGERQQKVVTELKQALAADATPAAKLIAVTRAMQSEKSPDARRNLIQAAKVLPPPEFEALLIDVLAHDTDSGMRGEAATLLGRLGSEKSFPALAHAAANDPVSDCLFGCIGARLSARRAATFALADLAARFPKLAPDAEKTLQALKPDVTLKSEQLGDARLQSLYQVNHDKTLLVPFYDRLKSDDAKVRVDGVVAFRFLKLQTVPPEITAALKDTNEEVRSWAVLVVGEIEKPKP